jgi:hypothetical protein
MIGTPQTPSYPSTKGETTAMNGVAWAAWTDTRSGKSQVWLERIDYTSTGISGLSSRPPSFVLEQNYPNPFNPSTRIKFEVSRQIEGDQARSQLVTLKVYDVLGREVATLVNNVRPPGKYEVTWGASKMASGVYLYGLQSGSFVQTRKMVILR